MRNPRFSVIIPAYNAEKTIRSAITSVLCQTQADLEAIIVDDGSTDATHGIIAALDDPRVHVVRQSASGTPAAARNAGLSLARGAFACFLDADDTWDPEKLARVDTVLDDSPETDVVCHAVRLMANGIQVGVRSYGLFAGQPVLAQLLYRGNFLTTSATVVRTSLLAESGGFRADPAHLIAEDLELWLRLAERGARFRLIPDVLGSYTVGVGVSRDPVQSLESTFTVLDEWYERLEAAGTLDTRRALARVWLLHVTARALGMAPLRYA